MNKTTTSAALEPRALRTVMAALLATILLAALDQTIVGVAVPTIGRELGGLGWIAWVVSGYLIASTVVTPLYGKLGDRVGRRHAITLAIGVFLAASVACALARSMPQLVLARVLQGAGGGGLIATAQAVIADVVPLAQRGRYQSWVSVVWAVASLLGPLVGGALTEYLSWPWIFWINLPAGLLALVLVRRGLAGLRVEPARTPVDAVGALLLLLGLTALLLPITRVGQGTPWTDTANLAGWLLSGALLAGFVRQERRHPDAILPPALLANRVVVAGGALIFICFFNFIALTVLVPLRLQLGPAISVIDAALHLLPLTLAIPIAAFVTGRWMSASGRVLPALRLGVGLVPVGLAASALAGSTGAPALAALIVTGVGIGLQMPTVLIVVQESVPRERVGTATALTAFFRQLGGAVGVAVLGAVVFGQLQGAGPLGPIGEGLHAAAVTAVGSGDAAFRQVLLLGAAIALVGCWPARKMPDVRLHAAPLPREVQA
jgi:EmrB/QacA subfamily drug resistance transporter